jgi:hypothetical protein
MIDKLTLRTSSGQKDCHLDGLSFNNLCS